MGEINREKRMATLDRVNATRAMARLHGPERPAPIQRESNPGQLPADMGALMLRLGAHLTEYKERDAAASPAPQES